MYKVSITGASGFVGKNLITYLQETLEKIEIVTINLRNNFDFDSNADVFVHLAGKAHDVKNIASPNEYYEVNTELTKRVFDIFLASNAKVFITLSSVKAVADRVEGELLDDAIPNPITHYGKSKLLAENYIQHKKIPQNKRVYILRPCMIHGPGNKGNLNLLYNFVSKGLPWPLGLFNNNRSYASIDNLCFIIKELIVSENIPSGIYNVADDLPLSTTEVVDLIAELKGKEPNILKINKAVIIFFARVGDFFKLPLNSDRLQKLTDSYLVSNTKIKIALGKSLPLSSREGLIKTFQSFNNNAK